MPTHALSNVSPCDLYIVIAHASFRRNCCISCEESYKSDSLVSDIMGMDTSSYVRKKTRPCVCNAKNCNNSYW